MNQGIENKIQEEIAKEYPYSDGYSYKDSDRDKLAEKWAKRGYELAMEEMKELREKAAKYNKILSDFRIQSEKYFK